MEPTLTALTSSTYWREYQPGALSNVRALEEMANKCVDATESIWRRTVSPISRLLTLRK